MLAELNQRLLGATSAPDKKLVVIAPRRQLLVVKGPFEPTNLLVMSLQLGKVWLWHPQISMQDGLVATPRTHEGVVPGDGADATFMAIQSLDYFLFRGVPDLELARVRPHSK